MFLLSLRTHESMEIHQTPTRHPPYTCQTPSRQFPNNFQTPTRKSPKFRHVGSFLLVKARCGFFLPFSSSSSSSSVGEQSQLLLQPTKVELGLQVGEEFDKKSYTSSGRCFVLMIFLDPLRSITGCLTE